MLSAKVIQDINKDKANMRILGINIPDNKRLEIGLTTLFGVGRSQSLSILSQAKVSPSLKPTELTADQENAIRKAIGEVKIEGDLKREVEGNIKRLKDIKSYRGLRHSRGLPSRGQRTKTNSRTRRGNVRKTMGSGKKSLDKK